MRRRFFNGFLTGGVLGALMGMMLRPQRKPTAIKGMVRRGKMARRMVKGVRRTIRDWLE